MKELACLTQLKDKLFMFVREDPVSKRETLKKREKKDASKPAGKTQENL